MLIQLDAALESKPHPFLFIALPSFVDHAIPIHHPSFTIYRSSSIVHRLSFIVYRSSSIVHRP
jgi:hypothetical protein